jgi:hypothetical protein
MLSNIEWGPVLLWFLWGLIAGGTLTVLWLILQAQQAQTKQMESLLQILNYQLEMDRLILNRLDPKMELLGWEEEAHQPSEKPGGASYKHP